VSDRLPLATLHQILQVIMGWECLHPYRFRIGSLSYESSSPNQAPTHPAKITLADFLLHPGDSLTYTYDLKDGWLHRLEVELPDATVPPSGLAECIAGERACPPEQAGGIWGYEGLLDRLNDPDDPDFEVLLEQLIDFDPEAFGLAKINQQLQQLPMTT
jgi:hypothetical protein